MNIYIGWLFKLIPLIMGLICIALGGFVLESSGQSEYFVAGHVLISLAAICLALFTTAFIIISQLTRGVNTFYNTLFPIIGYALMNPLMILVKIIKLRWIHILSYDQMVSRKINNQTTRCANS
ncbi:DUF2776 family protein, partial [Escherichia coli]|uniref:DUF2776 family protein n=1 Tax=Escherichia coli TaxID=562 RepID=UPI00201B345F